MGLRGPQKTPTKILELRGSWRAKKRRNTEPVPVHTQLECPDWLDAQAKGIWTWVVRYLEPLAGLATVDSMALAVYCSLFSRWREAYKFVQQYGETYVLKRSFRIKGEGFTQDSVEERVQGVKMAPQAILYIELSKELLRYEREFGMTPAARASIGMELAASEGLAPAAQATGTSDSSKSTKIQSKKRFFGEE